MVAAPQLELELALNNWMTEMEKKVPITEDAIKAAAQQFWLQISAYQGQEIPRFSIG